MAENTTGLTLSNKKYDNAKFWVQLVLPALGVLYASVGTIWGLPKVEEVVGTSAAVALFLGVILRISSKSYEPETPNPIGDFTVIAGPNGHKTIKLDLDKDPDDFLEDEVILFTLKREQAEEVPVETEE